MNHGSFQNMPMVLETPIDKKDDKGKTVEDKQVWADEIKLLESLIGMDADSDEFRKLEEELHMKGESERQRIQGQVDKKSQKGSKVVKKK
jgi:AP endonuclease-1